MKKTHVGIYANERIPAYISENRWNGWAIPYFTRAAVDQVLHLINGGPGTYAWFDEEAQAVFIDDEDNWDSWRDEDGRLQEEHYVERYDAVEMEVSGEAMTLWPVGASCWTWYEAD